MQSPYSRMISVALRDEFEGTWRATKIVMKWTGASERTVKTWLAGSKGPSGENLIKLAKHSDAVLFGFLRMCGRQRYPAWVQMTAARRRLKAAMDILEELDAEGAPALE